MDVIGAKGGVGCRCNERVVLDLSPIYLSHCVISFCSITVIPSLLTFPSSLRFASFLCRLACVSSPCLSRIRSSVSLYLLPQDISLLTTHSVHPHVPCVCSALLSHRALCVVFFFFQFFLVESAWGVLLRFPFFPRPSSR